MSVITIGAQYESLVSIAFQIIDNYIDFLALKIKAENMRDGEYLSDIFYIGISSFLHGRIATLKGGQPILLW